VTIRETYRQAAANNATSRVAPLPSDWSPTEILTTLYFAAAPGVVALERLRALQVQHSIDEFHARIAALDGPPRDVECCCGECA
jgi:hypothetical protein